MYTSYYNPIIDKKIQESQKKFLKNNRKNLADNLFDKQNNNNIKRLASLPKAYIANDMFKISEIVNDNEFFQNTKIKREQNQDGSNIITEIPGIPGENFPLYWRQSGLIKLPNGSLRDKYGTITLNPNYLKTPPVQYKMDGKFHLADGSTKNKLTLTKNLKKPLMDITYYNNGSIRLPSGYRINPSTYDTFDRLVGPTEYANTILRPDGIIETLNAQAIDPARFNCDENNLPEFCGKSFQFVFFGCWNLSDPKTLGRESVIEDIRANRDKEQISFGVLGGDNYYDDNMRPFDVNKGEFNMENKDNLLEGFAQLNSLNLFFMGILGNHDVKTKEQQLTLSKMLPNIHIFEFRSVDIYNIRFILINTNVIISSDREKDILYLYDEIIDQMRLDKHNILVMHHPIIGFYADKSENKKTNIKTANIPFHLQFVDKIFRKIYNGYSVTVLASDIHAYQKIKISKKNYKEQIYFYQYIVGTGGGKPDNLETYKYKIQRTILSESDPLDISLEELNDSYGYLFLKMNLCHKNGLFCVYKKVKMIKK
jgi:hypothetical protein